jgi:hypothetical protein
MNKIFPHTKVLFVLLQTNRLLCLSFDTEQQKNVERDLSLAHSSICMKLLHNKVASYPISGHCCPKKGR